MGSRAGIAYHLPKVICMADDSDRPQAMGQGVIQRLVRETNITVEQARELVSFLGHDWASLVREARLLIQKR
jgi:hypothetical protein